MCVKVHSSTNLLRASSTAHNLARIAPVSDEAKHNNLLVVHDSAVVVQSDMHLVV